MAISSGTQLGHYKIVAAIGAGGMGEVYRARDAKLGRDVALKVLPEVFARDAERLARFQREAKVLASLNHPNVAAIYGLEDSGSTHGLVMELVEGPTLADRIKQGPVPIDEALRIAKQICEALEYAHERGIVHRDLKPANVKVTNDDTVKVLDFGLAKAVEGDPSSIDISTSPTISPLATMQGVFLGTAAYMSPEQAKAKPVDRRADIWAFGCALYEMLTGRMAFHGETVTDTLASVIRAEPDWSLLPAQTPARIRVLLQRCLQKDPRQRLRDIGDARISLDEVLGGAAEPWSSAPDSSARHSKVRPWLLRSVGAALFAVAVAFALAYFHEVSTPRQSIRAFVTAPPKFSFAFGQPDGAPALSPDGTKLVYPAEDVEGQESLWVRPLDSVSAQQLPGTENALFPFWSPDSQQIGFFQSGQLKTMDLAGGPPTVLCDASNARGATWSQAGFIVFAPRPADSTGGGAVLLAQVPAAGGTPSPVATPQSSGLGFSSRWPVFLPDGHHFVYLSGNLTAVGTPNLGIYVGELGSNKQKFLLQADSDALYAPPGYLLFLRGETLMAQEFDAESQALKGAAFPVAEHVGSPRQYRLGLFSVSKTGLLIFGATPGEGGGQLAWFDATGKEVGPVGPPGVSYPRISRDGKRVAYMTGSWSTLIGDIWIADLERNTQTRFTFGSQFSAAPVWSPDGSQIAFAATTKTPGASLALYVRDSSGAGNTQQLYFEPGQNPIPTDWTRDGRYIIFRAIGQNARAAIWLLPLSGNRRASPYLETQNNNDSGKVSPDGRWMAYVSDESGTYQVYVSPFPGGGGKWQVSQGEGDQPQWSHDGTGLYYLAPGGTIMQVSVRENGSAVEIGTPRKALEQLMTHLTGGGAYEVSPDGKFLVDKAPQGGSEPLTLVTNWTSALKK